MKELRSLAKANTPTGVISLKMERPPPSIASKGHLSETYQPLAVQSAQDREEGEALVLC